MSTHRRMQSAAAILAAGMMLIGLSGCGDARKPPGRAERDVLHEDLYPQVAATEGLDEYLVVSRVTKSDTEPLQVTVGMRNLTNDDEHYVEYRFFFFDENGKPLQNNPDWHYFTVPARTEFFLTGTALDRGATDWRLEIRPARAD